MKFGLRSPFARAGPRLSTGSSSSGTPESQGGNLPDDVPLNSNLAGHSDNPNAGSSRNSRDLNSTGRNSHGSVGSRETFATAQQIHSPTNQEIAFSGQPENFSPLQVGISFINHGHAHGHGATSMIQDNMANARNDNSQVTSPPNDGTSVARRARHEITTTAPTGRQAAAARNDGTSAGRRQVMSGAVPQPGCTAEEVGDPFPAPKVNPAGVGIHYNGPVAFYKKLDAITKNIWDISDIDAIKIIYKTWLGSGQNRATTKEAYLDFKLGRNERPQVAGLPDFPAIENALGNLSIVDGHLYRSVKNEWIPKIIVPKSRVLDVTMDILWKHFKNKAPDQTVTIYLARKLGNSAHFQNSRFYMAKQCFQALVVDNAPEVHEVHSQRLQLENGGSDDQYPEYSGSNSSLVIPKGESAVAVFARQQEGESVRRHALESKKEDNRAAEQLRRDQLEANREAEQARRDKEEREERKEERAERAKSTAALTNLVGLLQTTIAKQDGVIGAVSDLSTTIKKKNRRHRRRRRHKNRHKSRRRHKQGLQSHGSSSEVSGSNSEESSSSSDNSSSSDSSSRSSVAPHKLDFTAGSEPSSPLVGAQPDAVPPVLTSTRNPPSGPTASASIFAPSIDVDVAAQEEASPEVVAVPSQLTDTAVTVMTPTQDFPAASAVSIEATSSRDISPQAAAAATVSTPMEPTKVQLQPPPMPGKTKLLLGMGRMKTGVIVGNPKDAKTGFEENIHTPGIIEKVATHDSIESIAVNSSGCFIVDDTNHLMSWGSAASGIGRIVKERGPSLDPGAFQVGQVVEFHGAPSSNPPKICSVAANGSHAIALTKEGHAYFCGDISSRFESPSHVSTSIKFLKPGDQHEISPDSVLSSEEGDCFFTRIVGVKQPVLLVACGTNHAFLQTAENVLSFGDATYGQLGRPCDSALEAMSPAPIILNALLTDVAQISLGETHSLVRTHSGVVYSCGSNRFGELGRDANEGANREFQVIPGLEGVSFIAAGGNTSYAVKASGELLGFGLEKALGLSSSSDSAHHNPTLIIAKVKKVGAHGKSAWATTTDGKLYCWGNATDGVIGHDPKMESFIEAPKLLSLDFGDNFDVLSMQVSIQHTMILLVKSAPPVAPNCESDEALAFALNQSAWEYKALESDMPPKSHSVAEASTCEEADPGVGFDGTTTDDNSPSGCEGTEDTETATIASLKQGLTESTAAKKGVSFKAETEVFEFAALDGEHNMHDSDGNEEEDSEEESDDEENSEDEEHEHEHETNLKLELAKLGIEKKTLVGFTPNGFLTAGGTICRSCSGDAAKFCGQSHAPLMKKEIAARCDKCKEYRPCSNHTKKKAKKCLECQQLQLCEYHQHMLEAFRQARERRNSGGDDGNDDGAED